MSKTEPYVTLTAETFDDNVLQSPIPVMVDFWAAWCGPCLAVAATVEQVAADFEDRARVAKVDVDENPELTARFGIRAIPTIVFFVAGQEVDRVTGVVPSQVLAAKLAALADAA